MGDGDLFIQSKTTRKRVCVGYSSICHTLPLPLSPLSVYPEQDHIYVIGPTPGEGYWEVMGEGREGRGGMRERKEGGLLGEIPQAIFPSVTP